MKFKKLFALMMTGVMASAMLTGCGGQKNDSDLQTIKDNGTLKIGYTLYEPMNYEGEDGKLTGFDTEFAEAVCEKLGVEPEFVLIDWKNKIIELEAGNIDCIWNGFTITDDMKESVDFTQPYVENKQVLVTNVANKDVYTSTEALKGKTVAVEAGSAGYSVASSDENIADTVMTVGKQTDALLELKSGTVDAAIFDNTLAESMIGEGTDFADLVVTATLMDEQYGIGFRKGSDLCAEVDKCIDEMREDGSLTAIADQYGLQLAKAE